MARGSVLSGILALLGASCCVLPIILVNLGLSSALVSHLSIVAKAKPWFMGLTLVLVGAAFYLSFKDGRKPSTKTIIVLLLATTLIAVSYIFPFYEGHILRWLKP